MKGDNYVMKWGKRIIYSIVIFIVAVPIMWKVPIYMKINCVKLPKSSEVFVKTKVVYSDIYWPHILGEKVIKAEMSADALSSYIKKNNFKAVLKNISICPFFVEWDDNAIMPDLYYDIIDKKDHEKYFVIRYYKDLW